MSVELATGYVSIVPSTRGIGRQLDQEIGGPLADVATAAGTTGGRGFASNLVRSSASGLADLGDSIVSRVSTAAKIAAGAGAALITAGLWGGVNRALAREEAIVTFRRMGLDDANIEQLTDDIDRALAGTTVTNPEGFQLAGRFLAQGFEQADIPGIVATIADMSQVGNRSFQEMADVMVNAAGQGRITAAELNRLGDVPLGRVAEQLGMTEAGLREHVSAGNLTAEAFLEAFAAVEEFNGAARDETTRQAFSNLRTAVSTLGEQFIGPLLGEGGLAQRSFASLREMVRSLNPVVGELGERFASRAVPAIESAVASIGPFVAGLRGAYDAVDPLSGQFAYAGNSAFRFGVRVRELFRQVGEVVGQVRAWIDQNPKLVTAMAKGAAAVAAVASAFSLARRALMVIKLAPVLALATALAYAWEHSEKFRSIVQGAMEGAQDVLERLRPHFDRLRDAVGTLADGVGSFVSGVWDSVLRPALDAVWSLIDGQLEPAFLRMADVIEWVGSALAVAGDWMRENKGVMQAAAGVIAALYIPALVRSATATVVASATKVKAWAAARIAVVQTAAAQVSHAAFAARYYATLAAGAVSSAATQVKAWVSVRVAAISTAVQMRAAAFALLISSYAASTKAAVAAVATKIKAWALMGVQSLIHAAKVAAAWVLAMGPIGWVIAAVVAVVAVIVANWDTIVEWTRKAWDWVVGAVTAAWDWITGIVSSAVESVVGFFTGMYDSVVGIATGIRDSVTGFFGGMRDRVIGVVSGLRDRVVSGFQSMRDRVRGAVSGLRDRVVSGFQSMRDRAVDLTGRMRDGVQSVYDRLPGPIQQRVDQVAGFVRRGFDAIRNVVREATQFVRNIATGNFQAARDQVDRIVAGLRDRVVGIFNSIRDRISAVVTAVRTRVTSGFTQVRQGAIDRLQSMLDWVRGLPQRILSALGNMGNLLKEAGRALIRGFTDGIKSMISAPVNAVKNMASSVRGWLPFSPAKEGPFSGKGWTLYAGQSLVEGFAQGMEQRSRLVAASAGDLAVLAHRQLQPAIDGMAAGHMDIGSGGSAAAGLDMRLLEDLANRPVVVQVDSEEIARANDRGTRRLERRR